MTATFQTVTEVFEGWAEDVRHGTAPESWECGAGFEGVELGPGRVVLLGGAPGAGKTALAMQWTLDALRNEPGLRALVLNVEMAPWTLLDRQLARLSGVDATAIRRRCYAGGEARVERALAELQRVGPRLAFHVGPPTLRAVHESVGVFGARLLVLDYAQRLKVGKDPGKDAKAELDGLMEVIRLFANDGLGVLVVSAVARQKGRSGSDYNGLGLASFRGSSELEYGADSAWVLSSDTDDFGLQTLVCVKNRHGKTPELHVCFEKSTQTFREVDHGDG